MQKCSSISLPGQHFSLADTNFNLPPARAEKERLAKVKWLEKRSVFATPKIQPQIAKQPDNWQGLERERGWLRRSCQNQPISGTIQVACTVIDGSADDRAMGMRLDNSQKGPILQICSPLASKQSFATCERAANSMQAENLTKPVELA